MKKTLVFAAAALLTVGAFGQELRPHGAKSKDAARQAGTGNLTYHGGSVMKGATVVCLFWGTNNMTSSYISAMQSFRTYGIYNHTQMLSQYSSASASSSQGSGSDVMVATPPSTKKVTDSMVQSFVAKYANNTNAIYEVFIPNGWYSDDGTGAQSCGGTNLQFCAYHSSGDGSHLGGSYKYSIQPYPSCSGCSWSGWTTNENANHFAIHETRETITDEYGNAWYDASGYEADDKCAWTGLFLGTGSNGATYGYQPEWSNTAGGCVQK